MELNIYFLCFPLIFDFPLFPFFTFFYFFFTSFHFLLSSHLPLTLSFTPAVGCLMSLRPVLASCLRNQMRGSVSPLTPGYPLIISYSSNDQVLPGHRSIAEIPFQLRFMKAKAGLMSFYILMHN